MTKTQLAISELLKIYFHRRVILPADVWVEENIRLSSRQSTHQGHYSLSRTPWARQIYKDSIDPEVRVITLSKSAQIGASQVMSNILLYYIANKTLPCAIYFPSQAMSQQFAERNLHPCISSTKAIQPFLTGNADDLRRAELIFTSCTVKCIGGGSASKVSSVPLALAICDEASKFESFQEEADAIELIFDRTLSYHETKESKIIITSTPTLDHTCQVTRHFREGNQQYFYVPCIHCSFYQILDFQNVRFGHCKENGEWNLDRVLKDSYYECTNCHGAIHEEDKFEMINKGEWRAHNPSAPLDLKSYTISALYSLSLSFGSIARMFLSAKKDRSKLQNFHNSILGKAWTPQAASVNLAMIDSIIERSPDYIKGEIPAKIKALILSIDTQQADFYFMVSALLENGGVAIVDHGLVVSFEDLTHILNSQYKIKNTNEYVGIMGGIQDAGGNRSSMVYDFCLSQAGRMVASYGKSDKHKQYSPIRLSTITYKNQSLRLINVHDTFFTNMLLLNVLKPGGSEALYLPKNTEQVLKDQLTSVSLVEKKDAKGFLTYDYVNRKDNHLFDCLKLAYALRYYLLPTLNEVVEEAPAEEPKQESFDYSSTNIWN